MSEIADLLSEHALYEAYEVLAELEEALDDLGYELPEDIALNEVAELMEEFLQEEDLPEDSREQLDEIFKKLAHAAGRVAGGIDRAKKAVSGYKKGVKKAFQSGRLGKKPAPKKKVPKYDPGVARRAKLKAAAKRSMGGPKKKPAVGPKKKRAAGPKKPRAKKPSAAPKKKLGPGKKMVFGKVVKTGGVKKKKPAARPKRRMSMAGAPRRHVQRSGGARAPARRR
jgi:hypothetical protein